jgi:hypothetical protein
MNSNSSFKSITSIGQLAIEELSRDPEYKITRPKFPYRLHKKTLTVLTEEELLGGEMEVNKFDCFITPREGDGKIQTSDYMFLNSWQNTINKIDFNYTTTKKQQLDQSICSKSTIKKVEDYLRYESTVKINFDEFEYEKLKLKWREGVEVVKSESFSIISPPRLNSPYRVLYNVILFKCILIVLLFCLYLKTHVDNYLESIVYRPVFRYELVFHDDIDEYIKYK